MENKKILHIVYNDKFISGYINFLLMKMTNYQHTFIIANKNYELDLIEEEFYSKVKQYDSMKDILSSECKKIMLDSDKIIVSGIFGVEKYLPFLPNNILSKTYLQFWGGDFYSYRDTRKFSKRQIHKRILHNCIKRCKGIINLIPSDYEAISEIFPNTTKHYVAIMPRDPRRPYIYDEFIEKKKKTNKVLVGNSSTKENNHIEVFKKIEHLKNEDIEIISPLSYGDMNYKNEVIDNGKRILGEKFKAITEYIKYEDYNDFLNTVQVAIFNNDRQQAMGTINTLLRVGTKIYMRSGTAMWEEYKKYNLAIFDINELDNITVEELFNIDIEIQKRNIETMKRRDAEYDNSWNKLLEED